MKRKTSESKPSDHSQIGIPSQRRFRAIRGSDSRFPITTDISGKKRVKFSGPDDEDHRPPRNEFADNAKTSEYAFFKKLKEGASHRAHSCSLREEVCQTKNLQLKDASRERINMVQNERKDMRSSFLNENATPGKSLLWGHPDLNKKNHSGKSLNNFEDAEAQKWHPDVFLRKRQKLCQWVAETTFIEMDELCLKGYNFVSELLSRLIPKCSDNNKFKDLNLSQVEVNDKSTLLPSSYETDTHFRKYQPAPAKSFMELVCGTCLDVPILSCWSSESSDRILCSSSPTSYAYKNHLQYRVHEPYSEMLGGSEISSTEIGSLSVLPFKEYGLVTSGHAREMDLFCQPREYLVERELHVPMLGWDFDCTEDGRDTACEVGSRKHRPAPANNFMELVCSPCLDDTISSCWSTRSSDRILCSGSPTSYAYNNYFQYRVHEPDPEILGGSAISSTESDSLSVLPSKEYGLVTSGHVSEMDLFCQPRKYLVERELRVPMLGWDFDCTEEGKDTACEVGSSIFPLQNDHFFMRTIINEGHYLPTREESAVSSHLLTYDVKNERCLDDSSHTRSLDHSRYIRRLDDSSHTRIHTHFTKDDVSIHESPAFCPQISLDREEAWPLVLHKSSWDTSNEREMNFDGDISVLDDKVNFRKWLR